MGRPEQPTPELHWWVRGRRAVFSAVLARHLHAGDSRRILEVACGSGLSLPILQPFGSVVAVDLSGTRLQWARGYDPELLCQADIHRLPFASDRFDLVAALDVVEHSEAPDSILAEMHRVCAVGGKAFVSVPAFQFLWGEHDFIAGHVKRYTARQLKHEVRSAGFQILQSSYFNFFLFPPFALFRWVKWRRTLRRFRRWNAGGESPHRDPREALVALMKNGYEANVHLKTLAMERPAGSARHSGSESPLVDGPSGRREMLRDIVRARPDFVGQMSSDFGWLSRGLGNRLLGTVFSSERILLPYVSFPFGASILAIAEKR